MVSKQEPDSYGCLLELTWNGQKSLSLGGVTRKFLEDGDEVVFTGLCKVFPRNTFQLLVSVQYGKDAADIVFEAISPTTFLN